MFFGFFLNILKKEHKKKLVTLTWYTSPFKSATYKLHLLTPVSLAGASSIADEFD